MPSPKCLPISAIDILDSLDTKILFFCDYLKKRSRTTHFRQFGLFIFAESWLLISSSELLDLPFLFSYLVTFVEDSLYTNFFLIILYPGCNDPDRYFQDPSYQI